MHDPWIDHLAKYDLVELHNEAQKVGYRIRVANGWEIHLEYEGGLARYYQLNALRIFRDTDEGREQARAFLAAIKVDLSEREENDEE